VHSGDLDPAMPAALTSRQDSADLEASGAGVERSRSSRRRCRRVEWGGVDGRVEGPPTGVQCRA
jgi:hypothetical protein